MVNGNEGQALNIFTYTPLAGKTSFRLLELLPGCHGDEIQCRIDEYVLDQTICAANKQPPAPPYAALSYTWGDLRRDACIQVNGRGFSVTDNLYSALTKLRRRSTKVNLWIDAICINQADTEERGHQVLQMRRVYEQAANVVIWLGSESDGSNDAMEIILQVAERFYRRLNAGQSYSNARKQFLEDGLGLFSDNKVDQEVLHTIGVLRHFFARSWFSRVWIIQESTTRMDASVLCGDKSISWADLKSVAVLLMNYGLSLQNTISELTSIAVDRPLWLGLVRYAILNNDSRLSSLDFLAHITRFEATDPRDKVYAIMHLTGDKFLKNVSVNYHSSIQDVYTNAIKCIIDQQEDDHKLDFLGYCDTDSTRDDGFPSWLPDWRQPFTANPLPKKFGDGAGSTQTSGHNMVYSAGIPQFYIISEHDRNMTPLRIQGQFLEVYGFVVDTIEQIFPLFPTSILEAGKSLLESSTCGTTYVTGESFGSVCLRTSMADVVFSAGVPVTRGFPGIGRSYRGGYPVTDPLLTTDFGDLHKGRAFAATKDTRIGLVRRDVLPGDKIFVILGSQVLYVLRPKGDNCYTFVGECYVHGLMDGEVFTRIGSSVTTSTSRISIL